MKFDLFLVSRQDPSVVLALSKACDGSSHIPNNAFFEEFVSVNHTPVKVEEHLSCIATVIAVVAHEVEGLDGEESQR